MNKYWKYLFPVSSVVLLVAFMGTYFNRFIPVQEGWMQYYSLLMDKGMLPYRDFYFFTQPLSLFFTQLISKTADGYLVYRVFGMLERVILIIALYILIAKHFSPLTSFIAVTTSTFVYHSINIDILYSYYHTTQVFFFIALIFLQRASKSRNPWLCYLSVGIFASLAFFTKQSSGLAVSLLLLLVMSFYHSRQSKLTQVGFYILGWIIPAILILGWLVKNKIFFDYLDQVFGGISAKGSITNILFGFWTRNYAIFYLILFLISSFIVFILYRKKFINLQEQPQLGERLSKFNLFVFCFFPLFLAGGFFFSPDPNTFTAFRGLSNLLLFWVYFSFYFLVVSIIYFGISWTFNKNPLFNQELIILILSAFTWTYSVGLSGQLELSGILLGNAVFIAFILDRIHVRWKHYVFMVIVFACLTLLIASGNKSQLFYSWWGWSEVRQKEYVSSEIPALKNFLLAQGSVEIYDAIYFDILSFTNPSDFIYTYPHLTMFNYITERLQPTFAPVGYFDVCPDQIAKNDAVTLLKNPPKMIIYMEIPEKDYRFHEDRFRNGQKSGQRDIDAAIHLLIKNYKIIDFYFSEGWNWPIYVYLRE